MVKDQNFILDFPIRIRYNDLLSAKKNKTKTKWMNLPKHS